MLGEPHNRRVSGAPVTPAGGAVSLPRAGESPASRSTRPSLFTDHLASHGNRAAIVTPETTITYAELDERVSAVSDRLGSQRRLVLIGAANAVEPLVAYLAALRGGHPVLLAPGDNVDVACSLSTTYDPDVVITTERGWAIQERRSGSAHTLHPDLTLLLPTSGSTGSPKLVRLSRQNLQSNAEAIAHYLGITSRDRAATTLPMQYCYGLSVINSHLQCGAGLVLTQLSVVDRCFWDLFRASEATSFAGVPYTFDLLDRVGFEAMSLPALRCVTQAGGRLDPAVICRYAALAERDGWQFFVMYGQTEATARMAYLPPDLASTHPESIGIPIPGGSFTIESPDNGVGELVYRGPNVMLGYAEHPSDLTRGASVDALHTGDLARRSPEGLYELVGRRSRFVKPYGVRIDLDRVEELLAQHGVTGVCTGDDTTLVVAVEPGCDLVAIGRLVGDSLGLPRSGVNVLELEPLPRLDSGKPDYLAILAKADDDVTMSCGATDLHAAPGGPEHHRVVRDVFAAILMCAPGDDDTFVSLGGDSLSYVEMSIALEEILGVLPNDWHTTPLRELVPARRGRLARVETGIVLRAVAIVLVVGSHAKLWHLLGGAHALLGIAGYNFARFQLRSSATSSSRTTTMVTGIARIALPSMCWIAFVAVITDEFNWGHALLVNGLLGDDNARWSYWYIEAIVQILILLALLFAVPSVRRLERQHAFSFALAVVGAGLAIRFDLLNLPTAHHKIGRPHEIFWLFSLGWAAERAAGPTGKSIVSLGVLVAVPGFFGATQRELIVGAGLLLIIWVPNLALPRAIIRPVGTVAGASLYIYLTHWQVYPFLLRHQGPAAATTGSVLVGIAAWFGARWIIRHVERRVLRAARRVVPRSALRPLASVSPG